MQKEYFVESKEDKLLLMRHKNEYDTSLNSFIRRNRPEWEKEISEEVVDVYGEIRFKIREANFQEKKLEKFLFYILDSDVLENENSSIKKYTRALLIKIGLKWKKEFSKYFEDTTPKLYESTIKDQDTFLEILLFDVVPYKIEAYWLYEKINQKENKEKELFQIVNVNYFNNIIDMIRQISRYCTEGNTKILEKDVGILLMLLYDQRLGIPSSVFATPFFSLFDNKKYSFGSGVRDYINNHSHALDEMELLNELEDLPLECGSKVSKIQEIYDKRILSQDETNRTVLFGDNFLPKELLSPREFIRESSKLTKEVIQTYLENQDSEISFVLPESDLSFLAYEYGMQKCLVKNPEETKTFVQVKNNDNNKIFLLFKLPKENFDNIYGISLFPGNNHKSREIFSIGKPSHVVYKVQAGKGII